MTVVHLDLVKRAWFNVRFGEPADKKNCFLMDERKRNAGKAYND